MLHDLLFVGEILFALLGMCLIWAGLLSLNAVNFLKSKEDGQVLYEKYNSTNDRIERYKISMEALSRIDELWRSIPATRWSFYVGLGMWVGAMMCAWLR